MLVLALLVCWFYARRRSGRYGIEPSHIDLAVPLIFFMSTAGGRALSMISPGDFDVAGIHDVHLRFRLFGLLVLAIPLLFAYSRLAGLSFRRMADLFAIPAIAWLMILRIGCLMAGCCWGKVTHSAFGLSFPSGSLAWQQQVAVGLIDASAVSSLPIHPTQLYECVLLVGLLLTMLKVESQKLAAGMLGVLTVAGYTVIRFPLEFLRADSATLSVGLTFTQIICLLLLACGILANRRCRTMEEVV